ncbi:MAG: 50S ribosomal protein L2, partial [Phycisphaerales bacterium]
MPIRVYKRVTNGRRNASVNIHAEVTKKRPEKSLLRPLHKTGGRNCQ